MSNRSYKAYRLWSLDRETQPTVYPYFQAPSKQSGSPTKPVFFDPYFPARPRETAHNQQASYNDTPPASEDFVF